MEAVFWILAFIIVYTYFGYPIFLKVLSLNKKQSTYKNENALKVTLIIAAHNEEEVIREKIENSLSLDYPKDKLEIIVASDASTDRTNEIVLEYANQGVILNLQEEHKGKSAILNDTVLRTARGEIVVFTDATTFLKPDALKKLARNFANTEIGAVCARLLFVNQEDSSISQTEGIYWRYEEFLRRKESEIGILPFVSGAFYGIRKHLYTPVREDLPDDSISPLSVYKKGYQVVFEEEAVAYEKMASTAGGEFRIKSRGGTRELGAILSFKELLNPFKYPLLSWVLFSHRLLRWSVGFFLVFIFALNVFLLDKLVYLPLFLIQVILYLFASIGFLLESYRLPITNTSNPLLQAKRIFSLPFYYCIVNFAALSGIIQFLLGKKKAVWQPER